MGNLCGQERQEPTQIMQSKVKLDKTFGNLRIQVIQGEVLSEKANAFLNAANEPYNTQLIKKIKEIKNPQVLCFLYHSKNGVPQLVKFEPNHIDYIIMIKLCEEQEEDYENQRTQAFLASFELANKNNLKILSFTDPPQQLTQKLKIIIILIYFYRHY